MKKYLVNLRWKVLLNMRRVYFNYLLKCCDQHILAIYLKAYIQTFSLFPNNDLKTNLDIAWLVRCKLISGSESNSAKDITEGEVQLLYAEMKELSWVRRMLSNFHSIRAHGYSLIADKADSDLTEIESEKEKAKYWFGDVLPINNKNIDSIYRRTKKEIRSLRQKIRNLNTKRLNEEKLKVLTPVKITTGNVVFSVSLFSSLFVVSGFIYNRILFSNMGLSVSDFFSISDYLASSIEVISSAVLASVVGLVFYFWRLSELLFGELKAEQFGLSKKERNYLAPLLVVSFVIMLVVHSYQTGELLTLPLFALVLFVILNTFHLLPFWRYVENKVTVAVVFLSVLVFSIHLGMKVKDKIEIIKSGEYAAPYVLDYVEENHNGERAKFISANSNYVFLWDDSKKRVQVLTRSAIKGYYSK